MPLRALLCLVGRLHASTSSSTVLVLVRTSTEYWYCSTYIRILLRRFRVHLVVAAALYLWWLSVLDPYTRIFFLVSECACARNDVLHVLVCRCQGESALGSSGRAIP